LSHVANVHGDSEIDFSTSFERITMSLRRPLYGSPVPPQTTALELQMYQIFPGMIVCGQVRSGSPNQSRSSEVTSVTQGAGSSTEIVNQNEIGDCLITYNNQIGLNFCVTVAGCPNPLWRNLFDGKPQATVFCQTQTPAACR
jgi:hypothetical protein